VPDLEESGVPTYQYRCTDCGEPLEAVQAFTDDPLTECPSCGGTLRKVFSSVGIVFKGSGFYRTDSRANGDGAKTKADTAAKPEKSESSPKADKSSSTSSSSSGDSTSKPAPATSGTSAA
jgi:putative FmdB family regulatory protein